MQGKQSRAGLFAGLSPNAWVVLFEREDPAPDPVYNSRQVDLHIAADHLNAANVEIIVQDSRDGVTWTNRQVVAAPLVPGGELSISLTHQGQWVRTLVYSTATGRVDAQLSIPEDQTIPGLWPDVHSLACVSYCEVSSES